MGDYDFSKIELELESFDKIVCDKNFKEEGTRILKTDYKSAKEYLLQNGQKKNILYVVTGSPLFYSGGSLIAKELTKADIPFRINDNQSSRTYMLSHFGISESSCGVLSLHGRKNPDLLELLTKECTFVLCDEHSVTRLQEALTFLKEEDITAYVGEKLGYADERVEKVELFAERSFASPYVLLIKREFTPPFKFSKDEAYKTERGMITKSFKRGVALNQLELEPNMLLWDVGAGSGSVGIEAYKQERVRTVFFEKNETRVENIKANLTAHKAIDAKVVKGEAETLFEKEKETPDRIFIGGGSSGVFSKIGYLYKILNPNGIILINVVTLKNLTELIGVLGKEKIAYDVTSLSLSEYKTELLIGENSRILYMVKIVK